MTASRWWAPGQASWWAGGLFAAGSVCFLLGPLRWFADLVGNSAAGVVLFCGSLLFTAAALVQLGQALRERRPVMRLWAPIQLAGAVLFNVDTFVQLQARLSAAEEVRLVWTPDAVGCACFLGASAVAFAEARGRRGGGRRGSGLGVLDLAGSIAFAGAAVASLAVSSSGAELDLGAANALTSLGAACFLGAAVLLMGEGRAPG